MNEADVEVGLSDREKEVLFLAGEGLTDKEIALRLEIGQKTVRTYWDRMRSKLGAASRTEVLAKAVQSAFDAVAASELRLRQFVASMPVMFNAYDEQSNIILVNEECERVTGYKPEQFYDGSAHEAAIPDDDYRARVLGHFLEVKGQYRDEEIEITCADGKKRVIAWTSRAKEAPIEGWASWAIGIDVTERVKAQRSLEQSEANFRRLLEDSSQGVWIVDTQHRTIFANQRLADMLACSVEDITSNDEAFFLDNESRQVMRELIATGPISGSRTRFTFKFKRKDGLDLWAYVDVAPIFDLEGDLQGHAAILTDISRSKALEQSVSLLRQMFDTVIRSSEMSFLRFDRQMSLVEASLPEAKPWLGRAGEELSTFLTPFMAWSRGFQKSFAEMEKVVFEGRVGEGDNAACYEVTLLPEPTAQQKVGYVLALLKPSSKA